MKHIKKYIVAGTLFIVPVYVTFKVIELLFNYFSYPGLLFVQFLQINKISPYLVDFVGLVFTLSFLILFGMVISNIFGKKIITYFETFIKKVPIVSSIYSITRQITTGFSESNKNSFKKVVVIEYPKQDLWTLALVTGESKSSSSDDFYHLFVPTTPNPTSGYMIMIKKNLAIDTDISIEEAIRIIVSGGAIAPKKNFCN